MRRLQVARRFDCVDWPARKNRLRIPTGTDVPPNNQRRPEKS